MRGSPAAAHGTQLAAQRGTGTGMGTRAPLTQRVARQLGAQDGGGGQGHLGAEHGARFLDGAMQ